MAANYIVSSSLFIKTVVETLYLKNCLKTYAVDPDQRESKGDVKNYMQVFEIKSNGLILNRRKRPKSDESSYGERQYPNRTNQLFTRTNLKLSFRFPHNPFFFLTASEMES